MIGELNSSEIESVLQSQILGHIGCHSEGVTYVVPISYAYDGEYFYGHSREGMKMDILRKNPSVCFQVEQMENMASWQSVVTWGVFEELTDPDQRNKAVSQLMQRITPLIASETVQLNPDWPFDSDKSSVKGVVFRIKVEKKTGRFEKPEEKRYFAS